MSDCQTPHRSILPHISPFLPFSCPEVKRWGTVFPGGEGGRGGGGALCWVLFLRPLCLLHLNRKGLRSKALKPRDYSQSPWQINQKEGRKEGRREGRREGGKEGGKEGREAKLKELQSVKRER